MKTKAKQLAMLITDAWIIADITNPSNWNYATYTGSLTGLEVNQYYYDWVYEYKFDGAILYRTNTITGMPMNELVINENDQEIYWKQFQSFANAISWIMATSVPTVYNRRAIRFSGYNTEDVALPEYVYLVGNGEFTSFLMWAISFLWTGQTLWGNCIFNCTAMNLVIDNSTLTPIYITPTTNPNTPAYAPRILEYTVTSAPVSWTYQLEIDTHTYVFNWNDDATVIQAAIRADYPQAVVNIPTMFDFMIYMVWLPAPQGAPNYWTLYRSAYNIDMVNSIWQTVDLNNTFTEGNIQVQEISLDNTPTQWAYQFAITYGSNLYGSNVLNWDADEATILTEIRNILHQAEVAEWLNLGSADTQIVGTALTTDISIILNNACQAIPEIDIVANTLASYPPIQVNLYRCNINVSSNVWGNQYGFFDSQLLGGDLSQANSQFNNCQIKSYYSGLF